MERAAEALAEVGPLGLAKVTLAFLSISAVIGKALPEAIGGGAVAFVLFLADWMRSSRANSERRRLSRQAARTELHGLRSTAEATREPLDGVVLRSVDAGVLFALVRIGMERTGDPMTEVELGRVARSCQAFNAAASRAFAEASGVSRAMGDHAEMLSLAHDQLARAARELKDSLDGLEKVL